MPDTFGPWTPLVALAITLLPLWWAQRWITRRVQELGMRWLGDPDVTLILYFVLVLPGVVIHELSHLLAAVLLGVRVRKLSLGPVRRARGQRVSLGSVEVSQVDPVRGSLIGVAPLVLGSAVILLIGNRVLGIDELAAALGGEGVEGIWAELSELVRVRDVTLWLYLVFAISNSMLPSESDMRAVRPVLLFLGIAAGLVLLVTGVPSIPPGVVRFVTRGATYLSSAFGLTLAVDLGFVAVLLLLLWATRRAGR